VEIGYLPSFPAPRLQVYKPFMFGSSGLDGVNMFLLIAAAVVLLFPFMFIVIAWSTFLLANDRRRRVNFAIQEAMRNEASALVFWPHPPLPIRSIYHSERCMLLNPSFPAPCAQINVLTIIPVDINFQTELEATLHATSNPEWCVSKSIQCRNHWGVTRGRQCVFKVSISCPTDFVFALSLVWFCKVLPYCIVASTAYTCNNHIVNLYLPTPTLHIWAYPMLFSVTICNNVWINLNVGKLIM